jgi:hypothetical protein
MGSPLEALADPLAERFEEWDSEQFEPESDEVWDDERAVAWMREFEPDYEAKVRAASISTRRVEARFILRNRPRPPRTRIVRPATRRREPRVVRRRSSRGRSRSPGRLADDEPDPEPLAAGGRA